MEIILSKNCLSLTGMLRPELGYYIRSTKKGKFYSQRSKHGAPPDGHWRFIVLCAELAQNKLHIADVRVSREEIKQALYEAHYFIASELVRRNYADKCKATYDARDILNVKTTFGL